jgi:tol-pal system protein YbgF
VVAALCVPSVACVTSSEGDQIRADIEALKAEQSALNAGLKQREAEMAEMVATARQDIKALQALIKEAEEALRRNDAESGLDIQKTREELARLRDSVEQLEQRTGRVEEQFVTFREDVDFRLANAAPVKEAYPEDVGEHFALAQGKLGAGEFKAAREAFEAFIKTYPEDERVDQAIFGVGETHFYEARYKTAIFEYAKILKSYPRSKKIPAVKLRVGQALAKDGNCDKAKVFLSRVGTDHPGTSEAKTAAAELSALEKGCK